MQSLCNDLSTLASVDKRVFDKLISNANFCICDYLESAALNNEDHVDINIGIGILRIKIGDGVVTYSFTPSQSLETGIVDTLERNQNLLTSAIDATLISRLNKLYDNLL